ncbi:MAG: cytochrome c biogenesis protein CcsA [Isosphaeraceae bacterium]|nr:cytochrome c biogenesis protein CcsA [Isosphaeraceae bacterium]
MQPISGSPRGPAAARAWAAAPAATLTATGSRAYQTLGDLAVQHHGRIKPLDTVARQEVKQVYGRETIKLTGPDDTTESWGPIEALVDWSARPDYWDEKDFILVEYLPLKRMLLAGAIREQLTAIAEKAPPSERERLHKLADDPDLKATDLEAAAALPGVSADRSEALKGLAEKLSEDHKWLSPQDLEVAEVEIDGKTMPFLDWVGRIFDKQQSARREQGEAPPLSTLERKAAEVGERLLGYQAFRDRNSRGIRELDLSLMPRPVNATYLKYTTEAFQKAKEAGGLEALNPVELDAVTTLLRYWRDIQKKERALPGTDAEFDKKYTTWLRGTAPWVSLRLLIDADAEELAKAGYPADKLAAFRTAYTDLIAAEKAAPGQISEAKAAALITSARDLGTAVSQYPAPQVLARESFFNRFAPFFRAPYAYGSALLLLLISLGIKADRRTLLGKLDLGLYVAGLLAFLVGIGLEVIGFYYRVRISGWAPVTNLYETVIWVALISAVIGLVMELIFRKKYAAVAASGVALMTTLLAANTSMLDPNIELLQPVLRSNYWLTIHVLTIVSSYAAFSLAMALGLIAVCQYLTATYKRSVAYSELAPPLMAGLPLLLAGGLGVYASRTGLGPAWVSSLGFYYATAVVAGLGGVLTIMGGVGMLGEAINRMTFREDPDLDEAAVAGAPAEAAPSPSPDGDEGGAAVATLTRPTVAEIRARSAALRPKLDVRTRAMQATAAQLKPLANFIYRALQVGVLLVAAGTILGGVWADYSWGRFWGWDPKEVWALITLLVYLVPLHGRFAGWVNTFGLVVSSVVCYMSVVMAWYGVNAVLGVGLHSYGFTEGGKQGLVLTGTVAVLAFVAAAAWRRWLAQYRTT